jgi:drug/metabolite transporter (DMT)-like permease
MNWFIFALLAVITMAGSEIAQKVALTREIDISAITNNAYIWLIQSLGGIIISLALGQFDMIQDWQNWLRLLILALIYFTGGTAYYTSYKSNSPSVSVILGSISVIISTTLGIIFFEESTHWLKFLGIALILIAILFVNYKKDKFKIDKFNALALLGGTLYGIAYSLDKSFVLEINPSSYLAFMSGSVGLVSFILKPRHIVKETKRLKIVDFLPMFVIAGFGILFNLFTFISYGKGGNVGVVDAINNSAIFIIILVEVLFLNDKEKLGKKIIAAITAVGGIAILSLV